MRTLLLAFVFVQDGFLSLVWVHGYSLSVRQRHSSLTHIVRHAAENDGNDRDNYYDDFSEDFWSSKSSSVPPSDEAPTPPEKTTTDAWWQELRARQSQLQFNRRNRQKQQWLSASCTTKIALVVPDWVRRIACGTYPWAAMGTAADTIFLANLATGQLWGTPKDTQKSRRISSARLDHVLHQLYGSYDGGGTIAVAMHETIVFEAPRTGGVYGHTWNPKHMASATALSEGGQGIALQSLGCLESLQDTLVTCLSCKDGFLWMGTDQGLVHAFVLPEDDAIEQEGSLPMNPLLSWQVGGDTSIVMSIHVDPNLACAVVAMDTGSVDLLHYGDIVDGDEEEEETVELPARRPIGSFTPPFDGTERRSANVFPTCASLVELSTPTTTTSYVIVCGANDGSLYLQNIRTKGGSTGIEDVCIDVERPLQEGTMRSLRPNHLAAVRCMAHPENGSGLLVTGGLDGTLRIWDLSTEKFVYQFVGYKVWLGSLWTDGDRIVSDGADNTLIVHDFSLPKVDDESSKQDASSKDGPPPYDPMI
jgi:hypothetical protein